MAAISSNTFQPDKGVQQSIVSQVMHRKGPTFSERLVALHVVDELVSQIFRHIAKDLMVHFLQQACDVGDSHKLTHAVEVLQAPSWVEDVCQKVDALIICLPAIRAAVMS